MSATLVMEKAQRKTDRIRQEIEQLEEVVGLKEQTREFLQASIVSCGEISEQWRLFVDLASDQWETFDYRKVGPVARDLLQRVLPLCDAILESARRLGPSFPVEGIGDVELLRHEATNILKWLEQWPADDPSRRNAARDDVRNGRTISAPEFVKSCRGAG